MSNKLNYIISRPYFNKRGNPRKIFIFHGYGCHTRHVNLFIVG